MKIVDRKTFLESPYGTVYCKHFKSDRFSNLSIKYETKRDNEGVAIDWIYMELSGFDDYYDSNEMYENLDDMRDNSAEFPLRLDAVSRDGFFEDDQLFAIYDKNDVNNIIKTLTSTLLG